MKYKEKKVFGVERDSFNSLFIFYSISQCGIFLILNSIYWDDWTIYNTSPNAILEYQAMLGSMFNSIGHLQAIMLPVGPWFYRILTFFLMFFSGILLWHIIKRQDWINSETRFLITMMFLILPFNWARITLIDFPYILCYFMFFLAWYHMERYRLMALILFFASFTTNSLLVFYALPIADWYSRENRVFIPSAILNWGAGKIDFMIIPFVYWAIKKIYFRPYGLYVGYNEQFSFLHLLSSPYNMIRDFKNLNINISVFICAFVTTWLLLPIPAQHDRLQNGRKLFITSIIALACALFPYCILGLTPTFLEWSSRHQLLMPLGAAMLLALFLMSLNAEYRKMALAIWIAGSLTITVQTYSELYFDWNKQKELVALMAENDSIRNADLVIFDDHTENARNRQYRFYEWNGLLKYTFSNEIHFGISLDEQEPYDKGSFDTFFVACLNARDHVRRPNQHRAMVRIEYADKNSKAPFSRFLRHFKHQGNYSLVVFGNA